MASTIKIGDTINAITPYVKYRPLAFAGLASPIYEPAITMANLVRLAILGPPFKWRWNRLNPPVTFTCTPGTSDYAKTVANYGWIETAAVQDVNDSFSPHLYQQLTRLEGLALPTESGRPEYIAPQYDDGAGNITFRLLPNPAAAYPVIIDIQLKPVIFSNTVGAPLNQTWTPIPDEYLHLYTRGMLALTMLLADDPRAPEENQKFVATLLATHAGLTENEANIFLATWMSLQGQVMLLPDKLKQGVQARGM